MQLHSRTQKHELVLFAWQSRQWPRRPLWKLSSSTKSVKR